LSDQPSTGFKPHHPRCRFFFTVIVVLIDGKEGRKVSEKTKPSKKKKTKLMKESIREDKT